MNDAQQRRTLRIVAAACLVCGLATYVALPSESLSGRLGVSLLLCLLAFVAGARPVRFPTLGMQLTATHPVLLCALVLVGPKIAGLAAIAGVAGAALGSRRRLHATRLAFNSGAVLLSTSAAWLAFAGFRTSSADIRAVLPPLALATMVYFLTNTTLVSAVVSLETRQCLRSTWTRGFLWSAASYFTGFTIAAGLLLILKHLGPWGLALALPPIWLIVGFYRSHQERIDEKQRRLEEVETLNARLEHTVGELREALAHVRRLQGLLPICMHCKKIRDDRDAWHQIESYITEHSEARFTHSICLDCRKEHYPAVPAGSRG